MSGYDEHQQALADAIAKVTESAMVTHYVVVCTTLDSDGDETTGVITSPGMPLWQAHGLLSYEAAALVPQPHYFLDADPED